MRKLKNIHIMETPFNNKPSTIEEYTEWLKKRHNLEISSRIKKHYEIVAEQIKIRFITCDFWKELKESRIGDFDEDYKITHNNYPLLGQSPFPEVVTKPFDSFLLKTYRKNVLENTHWPDPPQSDRVSDWILPQNWFERINDIVRACFVVKYLDGVSFLAGKIQELCKNRNLDCAVNLEAREEGYYAAHLSLSCKFEIPKINFDTEIASIIIEVQITSQLQEVIRTMLHKHYEERRKRIVAVDEKWQWNYKSTEFSTNYLGHILHYLEGMIVEIRDRQREKL
jgi:hypothetical protein